MRTKRIVFGTFLLIMLSAGVGGYLVNNKWKNRDNVSPLATGGGVVIAQAQEVETNIPLVSSYVKTEDARVAMTEKYLTRYNSPLLPYARLIVSLADTYNFDYRYILAIGQQESNLCKKIPEDSYNCWGYGIHSEGTLRFDSYELALKSYASYLKTQYFDKGRNTVEAIEAKYNPNSNGSWAFGVNQFMEKLENGDF